MYDIVIIGAGVIGGSIFRKLSRYDLKVCVVDKENDVAMGTTKANSAIIHAGFDPEPGTAMSEHNIKGHAMYPQLCKELDVPYKQNGALVLAFNEEDIKTLNKLYNNGIKVGVEKLQLLNKEEILQLEPNLSPDVEAALYAPTSGITSPYEFTIALFENACKNGGQLKLNKKVIDIKNNNNCFCIKMDDGTQLETQYVINAAGVYADEIHNMICPDSIKIEPRFGEYLIFDKSQSSLFSRTIFRCPTKMGKGILITPTVHGNLMIGPDAIDIQDKDDVSTKLDGLENLKQAAKFMTDKLSYKEIIKNFAGLRAISSHKDFIIEENSFVKKFIDVAGIKSPGLTAAPSIALKVIEILKNSGLNLIKKDNFDSYRKQLRFAELSYEEKNDLIKKDPRYGNIICKCEQITEGEIVDAIKRSFGVCSTDAIKRRCRPGMGRCQGGFCLPKVAKIIARECNINLEEVVQDKENSWILAGKTK